MPNRSAFILSLGIMAISAFAAISAVHWPLKTALFPLVISIPLFVLAAMEAMFLWLEGARVTRTKDFQRPPAEVPETLAARRALIACGWILAFFAAIGLVGFLVAVPIFMLLYLRIESRESWVFSIVFSAAVWGAFYGLFDQMLHLPFGSGLLLSWFFGS